MVKRDQNTNGGWVYEPSIIDLRFLKAVDYIIEKSAEADIKPNTDHSISKMVFGQGIIIKEIRNFQRGVAMTELHKFAGYFHLDFNYFFRGTEPMEYGPKVVASNRKVNITGENIKNMDVISETRGNIHKGDVYIINIDNLSL